MSVSYIEEGKRHLQEQEEMKASRKEIFTGLKDILKVNGSPVYFLAFPLIRKGLRLETTANGNKPEVSVEIWSRVASLEQTKKISMRIQGAGFFQVEKKISKRQEDFVVFKEVEVTKYELYAGRPYRTPQLFPLDLDGVRRFQDTVKQIKAELSLHSGSH